MTNDTTEDKTGKPGADATEAPDETGGTGQDTNDADDIDALEARIEALEADNAALRDKMLRALADAENTRRRGIRDRDEAEKFGGTRLARDLLSVHDNLERALDSMDDDLRDRGKDFIEGVELTQRELINAFSKHKIEPVRPQPGERFDPNLHQAMFEAPVEGAEPGSIIQVIQDGFTISGRILRPTLVGVARAAPKPATPEAEPEAPDEEAAAPNARTGAPPPPRRGAASTPRGRDRDT